MEKLRSYINSLNSECQVAFAQSCGTSLGYLRKIMSMRGNIREKTCIAIERESQGFVLCEDLRPDVDWQYLRNSK